MKCPNCGAEATFSEISVTWVEPHGEELTDTYLVCQVCNSGTDEEELKATQPKESIQ